MNIVFLSKDYPIDSAAGGVGTYSFEMSRLLSKLGHNVFIITRSGNNQSSEYVDDNGTRIFRVKSGKTIKHSPFMERIQYSFAVSRKLREIVKKYSIDIVEGREAHAEAFWYFFFHPRGRKPLLVIKLHTPESIIFQMNQCAYGYEFRLIRDLEEWWIRRSDQIIGLTNAIVELTLNYFQLKLREIPIVSNPIDIQFFVPSEKENYDNNYQVLYVGRLEFRKGTHVLMRAIPRVLKKIPETKFLLIGSDCGMKRILQNMVEEYDCEKNVILLGEKGREDLKHYYQNTTLCVVPSLWENHPYVCLEAMACGKPVIASNVAGIPEIIKHELSGILVPAGSSIQLANAIIRVLEDKNLREYIGQNARKRIEEYYSPHYVAKQNLKIYEKLLNKIEKRY